MPLSSHADDTAFKLYLSDTGLLRKLSQLPYEVILDATPNYRKFKGPLTVSAAASMLDLRKFLDTFHSRGNPTSLIFHSDQGTQYTSFVFCSLLKKLGVIQSFSPPGSPHDNAVAEAFFPSIKKEDFQRNFYKTEEEFCAAVKEYIEFYNDYRPHQRLGFLTPNQAEAEFYKTRSEE